MVVGYVMRGGKVVLEGTNEGLGTKYVRRHLQRKIRPSVTRASLVHGQQNVKERSYSNRQQGTPQHSDTTRAYVR